MRTRNRGTIALLAVFVSVAGVATPCIGASIKAFSLREANRLSQEGVTSDAQLHTLGGITRVAGMVFDRQTSDLILVGEVLESQPPVALDDLVVALRCRLLRTEYPAVSIDMVKDTAEVGMQDVRFQGGIENSGFGDAFLRSDVLLKRYSLDLLRQMPGVDPYLKLYEEATKQDLAAEGHPVSNVRWLSEADSQEAIDKYKGKPVSERKIAQSRFWFETRDQESLVYERDDVYFIQELRLGVRVETLVNRTDSADGTATADFDDDEPAVVFADRFTKHFDSASREHAVLSRLQRLFEMVCVAEGIAYLGDRRPPLDALLHGYGVPHVDTPSHYPLIHRVGEFEADSDVSLVVQVSGGLEIEAVVEALKDGDYSVLKKVVLESRPGPQALWWDLPLADWRMPGADSPGSPTQQRTQASEPRSEDFDIDKVGFSLGVERFVFDRKKAPVSKLRFDGFGPLPPVPPLEVPLPKIPRMEKAHVRRDRESLDRRGRTRHGSIGGVMLCNTARVEGLDGGAVTGAGIDSATGSFNLLVRGTNVTLKDTDLREFVTALWAVYFGKEDPGISIDPISADSDYQLVRFIGNIVDTGLAKTLLDADYYMKRCAIGDVRPAIPGFQSVDQLIGGHGIKYLGAGRRFWFVPKDMRFRRCGDALLFDGGQMTLLTEKLFLKQRGVSDVADQAFAQFWTDHYWEFAALNPVYEDMFDYARLTALAKYLKESGVSLQWFLLSNRHLVLWEDIPGAVPTLRTRSNVLRGIHWSGGVDLGVDMSKKRPGRYVIDETATMAIQQAVARHRAAGGTVKWADETGGAYSTLGDEAFTARLPEGQYTVLPARGVATGAGPRGVTYHTDLALRSGGEPGIELVRYNKPGGTSGLLGRCWDLYRPYALAPAGKTVKAAEVPVLTADEEVVAADLYVPERMLIVDRITGDRELLTLSKDRYDTVAWVPADEESSRFRGLACLNDGSCLLFEKSGCRFRFDEQARLANIYFSAAHGVNYLFENDRIAAVQDTFDGKVDLTYDELGRIARATSGSGFAEYKYMGDELALVKYSDGRCLAMIYNPDGSLSEVVCKVPAAAGASHGVVDVAATFPRE